MDITRLAVFLGHAELPNLFYNNT